MRRPVTGEIYGESRMSDWLVDFFQSLAAPCERIEVLAGRDNVIAKYDAGHPTTTILLDAHQDTVPVEGMTIAPFEAKQEAGRIFGRGAADVKGGMAAMLFAMQRLCRERPRDAPNVVLSCTCDEESTALGVRELITYWRPYSGKSRLLSQAPTVAIVAEPTDLDVVVAHRGVMRFRVVTHGQACHSSEPGQGRNAIYQMAHVVHLLEKEAVSLSTNSPAHPLCGKATLSVGRIEGGVAVNVVPDHCFIEVDRRLTPGEQTSEVWTNMQSSLAQFGADVVCEEPWICSPALRDTDNQQLACQLLTHIASLAGEHRPIGVPYCTNASMISEAQIPTVVFGPGSIAQAHTADEYIDIDQLDAAAEVLFRFCAAYTN
jgi:acetylornithine deacetylase/succinyl-diaminopimelate desuccinylase-like protein